MQKQHTKSLALVFGEILMGIYIMGLPKLQGQALLIAILGFVATTVLWVGIILEP